MNKPGKKAGKDDGRKLGDLSKQDWTDYQKRISELAGPIARVRKLFKDVQDRQLQRKPRQSRTLSMLPQNGELKDRFNTDAQVAMTIKKAAGQLEEQDLKRFHEDEIQMVPTQIDIVLMIDGSGSMGWASNLKNGVTPLDVALQSSAIMYEAAAGKDMNINVYVCMWGDNDPPIILRPGASRVEIGQAMQAARKGLSSGTNFEPALRKVAKTIGENRGKDGVLSGFTHLLILSDGDISDKANAARAIDTLFTHTDKVTIDTAIIGKPNTQMEDLSRSIKSKKPFQQVGVTRSNDPDVIPMQIVGLLLEKVRKCGSFVAVPTSQKRRSIQKAYNKMDKKK